jgi:hypothetical protein
MNKLLVTASILIAFVIVGSWAGFSLHTKSKYDEVRQQELPMVYAVAPLDQKAEAFLSDVQSNWLCKVDVTNGPDADVVKLVGMTPSVHNLVYVFNYQMPEYRWFSPAENRKASVIGLIKAKFFPISVDKEWHVSKDMHLAMLWCKTNVVYLYRDEGESLRASLYVRKKENIEPRGLSQ